MRHLSNSLLFTEIRDVGPRLPREQLTAWESSLGASLPEDYAQFLLEHNGGCYYNTAIQFPTHNVPVTSAIGLLIFLGLDEDADYPTHTLPAALDCHCGRIPDLTLPIAYSASDLVLLCLRTGGVYLWDRCGETPGDPHANTYSVADSFTEFALGCRIDPESELHTIEEEEPFLAIELHRLSELQRLLDEGLPLTSTNANEQTLLYVACRALDINGAEELMKRGADPDDGDRLRGRPPLWVTACAGAIDLTKLMLAHGASRLMDPHSGDLIVDAIDPPPGKTIRTLLTP